MTSYCHRISIGASVSNHPIRFRRTTSRTVEISRFLQNNYYLNNQRLRIVLRSRLWVVEAVRLGEVEDEEEENERCEKKRMDRTVKVMVAAAITVVLGVGNRVLYKLTLVPLKRYPFFLAQLATFGYFYQTTRTAARSMP
ncbi:protein CLT3, chloroplastic [Fagus crenata]